MFANRLKITLKLAINILTSHHVFIAMVRKIRKIIQKYCLIRRKFIEQSRIISNNSPVSRLIPTVQTA